MELASTGWDVISAAVIFVLGALFSIKVSRAFATSSKRALALYLWHTVFCVMYALYVMDSGGDAVYYYQAAKEGAVEFSLGTAAVSVFTMLFTEVLGLSFLGTFLAYNLFGYMGLLAFDASLQASVEDKSRTVRRCATLIVFLPSASFWSSAIGKDALSFMAAGLALWSALSLGRRAWLMWGAVALMLFVRPHIAALMVMALAGSMFLQARVSILQRLLVGSAALGSAAVLIPFALKYSGLEASADWADFNEYVDIRQRHNMEGGGGVDISSMSLPLKLFTYLFRPLPFEAHNIPALAASIDNVVLLLLMLIVAWQMIKRRKATVAANRAFLWIYSLSAWLILALTTANLGISVRQKWMFVPMLIFLLISVIGKPRKRVSVGLHQPAPDSAAVQQVMPWHRQ